MFDRSEYSASVSHQEIKNSVVEQNENYGESKKKMKQFFSLHRSWSGDKNDKWNLANILRQSLVTIHNLSFDDKNCSSFAQMFSDQTDKKTDFGEGKWKRLSLFLPMDWYKSEKWLFAKVGDSFFLPNRFSQWPLWVGVEGKLDRHETQKFEVSVFHKAGCPFKITVPF